MKATKEETHVFEEYFQNTTRLLVNETRDTLHTSTASKTTNSGFCYTYGGRWVAGRITVMKTRTLDVITKNFSVAFSSTLSESLRWNYDEQRSSCWKHRVHLSTFSAARHVNLRCRVGWRGWVWVTSVVESVVGFRQMCLCTIYNGGMWLCTISFVDSELGAMRSHDNHVRVNINQQARRDVFSINPPPTTNNNFASPPHLQWPALNKLLASLPVAKPLVNNSLPSLLLLVRLL